MENSLLFATRWSRRNSGHDLHDARVSESKTLGSVL